MANGNSYLAQQRAPLFAELQQKPWLLNALASIGESENSGKPLGILEAMFNRAIQRKQSLESAVRSGFWGQRTRNRLSADMQRGAIPDEVMNNAQSALDQIKAGSNVTQGATDQGMANEIKSPFKIKVDGEYFGDMDNGQFRAAQQAAAAKAGPVTAAATPAAAPATTGAAPAASPSAPSPSPASTPAPSSAVPGLYAGGGTLPSDLPGRSLAGVTPALREMLGGAKAEFERAHPGYTVVATSGARPGGPSSSQHATGNAIDMQIMGPNGAVPNTGNDPSGLYHQSARDVYAEQQANHPELNGKLAWGGAFGTQLGGGGEPDLMHFDLGGERGHWTMNRPSQLGVLPLALAGQAGAKNMADGQTQTGAGSGLVDRPTGPLGSGPGTPGWNTALGLNRAGGVAQGPKGKGGMAGSTAMSGQGGMPYIPILSEISAMFGGGYPGRPGLKGGWAQPAQAARTDQPWVAPVAAAAAAGRAPPTTTAPTTTTPAATTTAPTTTTPAAKTGAPSLQPQPTAGPPIPGMFPGTELPGGLGAQTTGTAGQVPTTQGGAAIMPGSVGPPGGGPSAMQTLMGMGARPLNPRSGLPAAPSPSTPAPTSPVAGNAPPATITPRSMGGATFPAGTATAGLVSSPGMPPWPTGTTAPTPNTPQARIPGILPGASAPLGSRILGALNPISSANASEFPPGPSATAAVEAARGAPSAASLPQAASFAERFAGAPGGPGAGQYSNPALAAALAGRQQPPNAPIPRSNPIAGTQTGLGIPPRGPWPAPPALPYAKNYPQGQSPPRTPQEAPGMVIAGIPLPRPRPQMPATPPVQIPQPSQAPPPASRPSMPLPGPSPSPSIGATLAGVTGPQSTAQGGPVPPPGPEKPPSAAQINADQLHNSPASGAVPTSSGDAGAPAVTRPPVPLPLARPMIPQAPAFVTPAEAARQEWLRRQQPQSQGDMSSLVAALQQYQQGGDGNGYYG